MYVCICIYVYVYIHININIYTYIYIHTHICVCVWVGIKVECTLVQALRLCTVRTAHRGSRCIALLFHDHGTRRGWGVSVTLRPLFTPGKTGHPLYRRLGGLQCRSVEVRKISSPPGFDPRTVQTVASRYTDWATRPTSDYFIKDNKFREKS